MNGFVIGISGGVDSAIVSTLCALTNKNVSMSGVSLDMSFIYLANILNFFVANFISIRILE